MNEPVKELRNQSQRSHLAQGPVCPQKSQDYKNLNREI